MPPFPFVLPLADWLADYLAGPQQECGAWLAAPFRLDSYGRYQARLAYPLAWRPADGW